MQKKVDLEEIKSKLHEQLPFLAERYRVEWLGVFGSYVRREQRPGSDLDILVTFRETPSLFKFVELGDYLTDLLGVKVDLVMKGALRPRIAQRVISEVQAV